MNPFEFVLFILVIVFMFKLLDSWMKHRHAARDTAEEQELHKRLHELEDRIRVLERIVTDERVDLKRQFRDLGT